MEHIMDDIDKLDQIAKSPKKASGDAGSVERESIKDLIEWERFKAAKNATGKCMPFKRCKMQAPGAE